MEPQLLVVRICKLSVNRVTNPNPVYSHSKYVTILLHLILSSNYLAFTCGVILLGYLTITCHLITASDVE
jgi:hypothetical protein